MIADLEDQLIQLPDGFQYPRPAHVTVPVHAGLQAEPGLEEAGDDPVQKFLAIASAPGYGPHDRLPPGPFHPAEPLSHDSSPTCAPAPIPRAGAQQAGPRSLSVLAGTTLRVNCNDTEVSPDVM